MVLSTEWSQVEVIDLVNDGSGLGFGIVGGRSTGVVVKSILPGIQRRIQIAQKKFDSIALIKSPFKGLFSWIANCAS